MMFTQTLHRKQMLERVPSLFSIRSRHNLHTSSMQQQQQQQQRCRGSSPPRARLQGQRQDPQSPSAVEAASPIVLTVSLPVSLSPLSSCSACPLCSYAVNFDGFPPFVRRYCRTYVNSQSTVTLEARSASTVSSTASTYWTRAQPYK